jgi:hypothetical protein
MLRIVFRTANRIQFIFNMHTKSFGAMYKKKVL